MALKPCKECGKEISTEAKVCPNCGKKNPTAAATPVIVWLIVGVVVFILIGSLSNSSSNSSPLGPMTAADSAQRRASDFMERHRQQIAQQLAAAKQLCHDAALKALKAPSTANFIDDETYEKDLGKGRSHIQLEVDAENSFSAKIRTTIDCKTRQTGGIVRLTSIDSWSR